MNFYFVMIQNFFKTKTFYMIICKYLYFYNQIIKDLSLPGILFQI